MSDSFSRREALQGLGWLIGAAGTLQATPDPQGIGVTPMLVPLSPSDPAAVALGYHEDAKTIDPKEFPTYRPGQTCSNCVQAHGQDGSWHYCHFFRGKLLAADGWCKAWAKEA